MTNDDLPIVIVAPTKGEASIAATKLKLPYPEFTHVYIGNGSLKDIEGLRADRYRTFFIDPQRINYRIFRAIEDAWAITTAHEAYRRQQEKNNDGS